jgi:hypothetical protein
MAGPGWIGDPEQLLFVLGLFGADRDGKGNFLIFGEPVFIGLTGEALVPAGAEYSVQGQRQNLAGLLATTSYGVSVTVIS